MRLNYKRDAVSTILFFLTLLVLLSSCPKPPINPWDEEGLALGLVTVHPDFETPGGTYHKNIAVIISCPDESALIYYTTDGTEPDESSYAYEGAINISGNDTNTVIKAVAVSPGRAASHVEAESFRIEYLDLTLSTGGNGTVSPAGVMAAAQDDVIQFSAAADSGFAFSQWTVVSGSGVVIDDIYSETATVVLTSGNAEVRAVFAAGTSLTVNNDGNGGTFPDGAALVVEDVPRTIHAYEDTGYIFKQWSVVSGSGVVFADEYSAVTQVTLTAGAASIRADFEPLKYNLNVTSGSGGSTSPGGIIEVQHDIAQGITAAESAGWVFSHWSIESGSGVSIADTADPSTSVTLTDGDAEIKANFVVERSLTIADDGNGTTNPPSGVIAIGDGMATSISATPDSGYGFSHWSTSGSASVADAASSSTTAVLSGGDGTVTAIFTDNNYELTVQSDANGSVVPAGSLMVVHGVGQSITATPVTTGYEFGSWTVTSGTALIADSSAAGTSVTLTSGAATVQANFVLKTYYLTMDDNGFGSTSASRNVTHGVDYGITASADSGYEFDSWSVTAGSAVIADSGSAATTVRLESGDATVRAIFTPLDYSLTISSDGNGTVDPSGLQTVSHTASTAISATPAQYYVFSHWSVVSGSGVSFDNANSAIADVTLTNGAAEIRANFVLETYYLTIGDNGFGSTTPSTSVTHGVEQPISATADTGYEFSDWEVTSGTASIADANSAETSVTLSSGDATIQANFSPLDYTLTVLSGSNGSVGAPGSQTVSHGASTSITAIPEDNYVFTGWTVVSGTGVSFDDAASAAANVTLTGGDAAIQANFIIESFALTITNDGNGTSTESFTVNYGVSNTITATPDTGYNFDSWEVTSGSPLITDTSSSTTDIILTSGPATINANFILKQYTLTINDNGHGSTSVEGDVVVDHGIPTGWITATPDSDYEMNVWELVDNSSGSTVHIVANINAKFTLTDGDATATAKFRPEPPVVVLDSNTNDSTPTISWSSPVAAEYDYYIWGVDSSAITSADTSHTWETLSDGSYTFYIRQRDAEGNESSYQSYGFTLDTVAPESPILVRNSEPAGEHDTTPRIYISNNAGVNMFRFSYTDGADWVEQASNWYYETDELSFGTHTIYAQMRDIAGNWSDSGSLTFDITLGIGSECYGGVVFYLDGSGGGMVAAPTDQSTGIYWWPNSTNADHSLANGTAIGTGMSNTTYVGTGYPTVAAGLCFYLDLNGYTDWFLPSRDELVLMMTNLDHSIYGLENSGAYWSSTVDIANPIQNAIAVYKTVSSSPTYQGVFKDYTNWNVRAVREF